MTSPMPKNKNPNEAKEDNLFPKMSLQALDTGVPCQGESDLGKK
jgi:hypothetical protein